jgi:membrane protease YdiL (CAAX protease family)
MNSIKDMFKNGGVATQLLLLFAIICFCLVVISPVTLAITALKLPEITNFKIIQLISSFGLSIVPAFIFAKFYSSEPNSYLSLNTKTNWKSLADVALLMIVAIPFINLMGSINQQMVLPKALAGMESWMKDAESKASELTVKILNVHSLSGLSFNVLLVAILPAIGEELIFRGVLIKILKDWKGFKVAIWVTAIIFSAIHLQFYGFIPRMLMGAFFGYLLLWSDSLWLPIVAHFTNNAVAIIFYYLKCNGYKMPDIENIGTGNTLWLGIASGALVVFGISQLKKQILKKKY